MSKGIVLRFWIWDTQFYFILMHHPFFFLRLHILEDYLGFPKKQTEVQNMEYFYAHAHSCRGGRNTPKGAVIGAWMFRKVPPFTPLLLGMWLPR